MHMQTNIESQKIIVNIRNFIKQHGEILFLVCGKFKFGTHKKIFKIICAKFLEGDFCKNQNINRFVSHERDLSVGFELFCFSFFLNSHKNQLLTCVTSILLRFCHLKSQIRKINLFYFGYNPNKQTSQ